MTNYKGYKGYGNYDYTIGVWNLEDNDLYNISYQLYLFSDGNENYVNISYDQNIFINMIEIGDPYCNKFLKIAKSLIRKEKLNIINNLI